MFGFLPAHTSALLIRLAAVLGVFSILRWVFYFAHQHAFPAAGGMELINVGVQGLRFDAMTIVLANGPFILLSLLPFSWCRTCWYQRLLGTLFLLVNTALLFLCCSDLALYGFTGKRMTRDVLAQADAGLRELPLSMLRYWWATLTFILAVFALVVAYRRSPPKFNAPMRPAHASGGILLLGTLFLAGRGGWQYQGLSPAHATNHVDVALAPLVTNSAFTFGYSMLTPAIPSRQYMSEAEMDRLAPLDYTLRRDSTDRPRNVVLLLVESLGREYISAISRETAFMPFLDSLCARSFVLTNAYANAEGSSKGTCAVLAGIPSFTDDAFMNTAFAGNSVEGIGTRLKEMGYVTAYFHGGINGEFKFDSFSRACGFDTYFGKDEFGDDTFYDGHWGIYDEEFLQFAAARMSDMRQPFCAGVFTLSSHDPFPIPARYIGRFPKGTQEIHESLGYVDLALRHFFERAAQEPWYNNTVFVITADHTFKYNGHPPWFLNPAGRFAVPIIFFTPDGTLIGRDDRVAQQLDIMPSVLDLVGYEGRVGAFGQSVFRRDRPDRAILHVAGLYKLIQGDRMLLFDGTRSKGLFDYRRDTLFAHDLSELEAATADSLERVLKAQMQRHYEALRNNSLTRQ